MNVFTQGFSPWRKLTDAHRANDVLETLDCLQSGVVLVYVFSLLHVVCAYHDRDVLSWFSEPQIIPVLLSSAWSHTVL